MKREEDKGVKEAGKEGPTEKLMRFSGS